MQPLKKLTSWTGEGFPVILFIEQIDTGERNNLLPVINALRNKANLIVIANEKTAEALTGCPLVFKSQNINDLGTELKGIIPLIDLVFTGRVVVKQNQRELIRLIRHYNLPTIVLEDYPGSAIKWLCMQDRPFWFIPDMIAVASYWAKKKTQQSLPGSFASTRIVVTGLPASDRLLNEDLTKVRFRVRKALGIREGVLFIVYMGTASTGGKPSLVEKTLKALTQILPKITGGRFAISFRPHPRDKTDRQVYKRIYQPILNQMVITTNFSSDEIGMAADIIISNGSTTGIDAVYRGIFSLNVFIFNPPQGWREVLKAFALPTVESGASPLVTTPKQLEVSLKKILSDNTYRQKLKKKMFYWKVDGKASQRVVEQMLKLAFTKDASKKDGRKFNSTEAN